MRIVAIRRGSARVFWAPRYFLSDYWLFGLEVPPVGYEWVRYGDDALLIDVNTGMILQVEYGVFV
jgi:Ni/Co efflux regulator RcnB